jgi:serine/threonine protein kinase/Tfp pilus assembly protein PilF
VSWRRSPPRESTRDESTAETLPVETPSPDRTQPAGIGEAEPGKQIGAYRLLRLLAVGGMGEVWLAEQAEPRRQVALKVIKAGMDTRQVVARFESERQALALMEHPAIAKVLDGGSTPEGRPYFVMEYVPGVSITEHCDAHRLSTAERLDLFVKVCEGVQHAHQKAVIHRDLKPSNILVSVTDGKAQPKVIDFGIAKAVGYRLTEKTLFTEFGELIGTPEYMSPEQADFSGPDVDTRSDVYSLGVVLYQLLTGELPFESKGLRAAGNDELRRILRDQEPPRPSTRVTTGQALAETARRRDTDPGGLHRQLKGDLDAVVMKALEKERDRRYGTPSELAADIARYLRNEPVVARPASAGYRLAKYVRRHRVRAGFAAALAALLVAFAVAMAVQVRRTALERDRANAERDRARREREVSDKVSAFLANMLADVKPEELGSALWEDLHSRVGAAARGRGLPESKVATTLASLDGALVGVNPTETALHLLDEQVLARAGRTIEKEMSTEPKIAGRLEHTLALTYMSLGLYGRAEEHARRAVDIRRQAFGADDPDSLRSAGSLASVYLREGRLGEAEKLHRETLDAKRRVLGPNHPDTLWSMGALASTLYNEGRFPEAEKLYRETLASIRAVLGPDHPGTLATMGNLALVYWSEGRDAEAEKLELEVLDAHRKTLGPDHPETLHGMNNVADSLRDRGHYAAAERLFRETLESSQRVLGPDHPDTLLYAANLGNTYADEGRYDEAEKLLVSCVAAKQRVLGPEHPYTLDSIANLARVYDGQRRYSEAAALAQRAVAGWERLKVTDRAELGDARLALGRAFAGLRRYRDAERELLEAERVLSREKTPRHRATLEALAAMYTSWEGSDPGRGHEGQAAVWRARLGKN